MSDKQDKVRELAEKLSRECDCDMPSDEAERILRAELAELLEAARDLLTEDLCEGRRTIELDGSDPEKRLAKQLAGWLPNERSNG